MYIYYHIACIDFVSKLVQICIKSCYFFSCGVSYARILKRTYVQIFLANYGSPFSYISKRHFQSCLLFVFRLICIVVIVELVLHQLCVWQSWYEHFLFFFLVNMTHESYIFRSTLLIISCIVDPAFPVFIDMLTYFLIAYILIVYFSISIFIFCT